MAAAEVCGNCSGECSKPLKCGTCKKAVYCTANCQKEDWRFHKRNCKKPDEPKQEPLRRGKDGAVEDDGEAAEAMKDPKVAAQVKAMMAGMGLGGQAEKEQETPAQPPAEACKNCAQPCAKVLKCGACKVATYCCAKCQKEDWQFHKRLCKKPGASAGEGDGKGEGKGKSPAAAAATASTSSAGYDTPEATPARASGSSAPPPRPSKGSEKEVVAGEDVGTFYNHRDWKPAEDKQEFVPQKVDDAVGSAAPNTASAWNAAGTWEEKTMLPYWTEQISSLKGIAVDSFAGKITVEALLGDVVGEAQIVHIRGTPRFLFDLKFELEFSCKFPRSSRAYKGRVNVTEFSNELAGAGKDFLMQVSASSDADKKAAEEKLVPELQAKLRGFVEEYNKKVSARQGGAFPGQLPPSAPTAQPAPVS